MQIILKKSYLCLLISLLTISVYPEFLPAERINADRPDFDADTARPLRYHPEGTDFVIKNGKEFFNRPLYGGNSAFRVDAGDLPECVMYLPGRGGNLRLGIKTAQGQKWLFNADSIEARYRPGSMVYEISDPFLGGGTIRITMLALYEVEGLIIKVEAESIGADTVLVCAYGGINGQRGRRDGDIGCEQEPVSRFFQLKPEYCKDNTFSFIPDGFSLESKNIFIKGLFSEQVKLWVADSHKWNSLSELLDSTNPPGELPVMVGQVSLKAKQSFYLMMQRIDKKAGNLTMGRKELPELFQKADQYRRSIAEKVTVLTPDSYINAAAAALCVSADGVWDEPSGTVQHGAVAWRSRLLGWRGNYVNDVLGWQDRSRRHLTYWANQQDAGPIPPAVFPADPKANLARNEPSLHSNGTMSKSHYDMNLVYIDSLYRHLLWTGDLEFARQVWPVIERHLAWERRLFRRPFDDGKSPLYEAYAAIWASDDLQYSGGGVTHTTAYNYYHNKMAARLGKLLGEDVSAYEKEANLILEAMRKELWLQDGWFAEYKDWLGLRRLHPSAGVYTFYHTVDSEVPSALEAWQMSRFLDTQIAHIPIHGPGIPEGNYFTVPSSNWLPYSWSVNNVVMAEAAHTALAYWQTGRNKTAFELFKGCILDSMYLGLCPGNVGMCTFYDPYRGESQRDFADGAGCVSRGLIEGLFGIRPDLLAGRLVIRPGFPDDWEKASIQHPRMNFAFHRSGLTDRYEIELKFTKPVALQLQVEALRDRIDSVKVNGKPAPWNGISDAVDRPQIEIHAAAASKYEIEIVWKGEKPLSVRVPAIVAVGSEFEADFGNAQLLETADPQKSIREISKKENCLKAAASGALGHRTLFVMAKQGQMKWWEPVSFEIRNPYAVLACESQNDKSLSFRVQNNTPHALNETAVISYDGRTVSQTISVEQFGLSPVIQLAADNLLPGTTVVRIRLANGSSFEGRVVNWKLQAGSFAKQRTIDLSGRYNDSVARIFKNEYISPRSSFCSLAIPIQGFGGWCNFKETPEIDDSGFRRIVSENKGLFSIPLGLSFWAAGRENAKNIILVSLWDNFPDEIAIPLGGKASHMYLLMAGSTNSMQCHIDNGEVAVSYTDGSGESLRLHSPTNWWPIDQDFLIDKYAFRRPGPIPPRVDLKTGQVRILDTDAFMKKGRKIPGGAALILDIPLNPDKELKSLTFKALSNEVVLGLMAITLVEE